MPFSNANVQLFRTVYGRFQQDTRYTAIDAVVEAARLNDQITARDLGFAAGKLREFKMSYYPVVCDGEGSCDDSVCNPGTVLQPSQQNFLLQRCTASKVWQLNAEDIRQTDDNLTFSQHAREQIASVLSGVRKALDEEIIAVLLSHVGCQPDGSPSKQITMVNPTDAAITPRGWWDVQKAFQDAGRSNPFVIGGDDIFYWQKATQIGGLNNQGQNTGGFGTRNMYYDPLMNQAFADPTKNHILAFDPRMLKFVSFSMNAGIFATDMKSLEDMDTQFRTSRNGTIFGSFADPQTNLIWDLNIRYVDCDQPHWTFQIKLHWDIFFLPEYVCNVACDNGIYHFTTCLTATPECPVVVPPTPPTPSVFEWNPAFTYPLYVCNMVLAGQSTNPDVTVTSDAELVALLNNYTDGYNFTLVGSEIQYTGFTAISGNINDGLITITFAPETT